MTLIIFVVESLLIFTYIHCRYGSRKITSGIAATIFYEKTYEGIISCKHTATYNYKKF